jgi:hypothetical protein
MGVSSIPAGVVAAVGNALNRGSTVISLDIPLCLIALRGKHEAAQTIDTG